MDVEVVQRPEKVVLSPFFMDMDVIVFTLQVKLLEQVGYFKDLENYYVAWDVYKVPLLLKLDDNEVVKVDIRNYKAKEVTIRLDTEKPIINN